MLVNVPAPRRKPHLPGQRRRRKAFDIMGLPADVFMMLIKDHLTIFERAALALVCKAFAEKVLILPSLLRLPPSDEEHSHHAMTTFLRNTMKPWFPARLKFCANCGKYVPKDNEYWNEVLRRECKGRAGKLATRFFGWSPRESSSYYRRWGEQPQCRVCPRCNLHISRDRWFNH